MVESGQKKLRTGWTTGACATAAAKAAYACLLTGEFPDPVSITLPRGEVPLFALASEKAEEKSATAAIVKDAGDDPDVTHGALVQAKVTLNPGANSIRFLAGPGVGTVTKPGLPIPVGEPAINPMPRQMIGAELQKLADENGVQLAVDVEISISDGEMLAQKTMNPRLGIIGGLSVLGTTGIVRPFSCAAWIASIHRGVDVARATGLSHVAAATGATSENVLRSFYPDLQEQAYLDMGDFAGGLLKYLRAHPIPKLTISGGVAKLTKLAQGAMDLHSARSSVDFAALAQVLERAGASPTLVAETAQAELVSYVAQRAAEEDLHIGQIISEAAKSAALTILRGAPVSVEVIVTDRKGQVLGHAVCDDSAKLE
ncbi:cobalt-precorrin-6A synthase [Pseudovibrio axinellae]|uniref:Cobalt-precorrin-5B C(1)-methyltransferase n=1 Tax=Pseudovibrio axinellae TaxID=989403 RepID=A0A165YV92_9HYPH|nr:cobalt-precorrin-5B (C(1))-methyltransferase [Pseudovibrio axinellae]KZL19265.1 cobalt-precorrin-6A synthase [Pseudovibrio axinellae]SEQ43632.1 cobalt-precorrin-5B (C1)-methyltransferase [Pseudovibrio axinellae]